VKGKRIEFQADTGDRTNLRAMIKKGQAVPVKDLIVGERSSWRHSDQATSVVGWLLGPANRGKTKGALHRYVRATVAGIEEAEREFEKLRKQMEEEAKRQAEEEAKRRAAAKEAGRGDGEEEEEEGETEEDENEEADQRREAKVLQLADILRTRSKEIREKAFQAAFGHLSEKNWKSINARWRHYAQ
jgi:hypothetical protein